MNEATNLNFRIPPAPLRHTGHAPGKVGSRSGADNRWNFAAVTITSLATLYFGILALINAHFVSVNYATVAAAEGLILLSAAVVIVSTRFKADDTLPIVLLFAFALLTVWVSLLNDSIFPDPLRNIAIISLFTMLGLHTSPKHVDITFMVLSVVTLLFLTLEIGSTDLYVEVLKPASFYQNFRGFQAKEWDESGLFGNALGFASRWSFGLFSHRTSSIFTEQVSLANFAGVLTVMMLTRWPVLPKRLRLLHVVTILAILLTNSSRTSTMLAVASVALYAVYPRLPRYGTLLIAPLILLCAFGMIAVTGLSNQDDLVGRVSITVKALQGGRLPFWLGAEVYKSSTFLDTGYAYVISSTSIVGLLLFWFYVGVIVPQRSTVQKRCAYALALYIFGNMLIGGTAIFAMKVAAPLWLLVGMTAKWSKPA